ncbi:MAG: flavin reductase family protein [Acidimicrobiales bacterium]
MSFEDAASRLGGNPFATPIEARAPARRLRGRLAAPVTVWTAQLGSGERTGITVSSVLVAEGEPPDVLGLVDPLSVFFDAAQSSGHFVVHVLSAEQTRLAEKFALRFPGDPFDGEEVSSTRFGPALESVRTRASCTFVGSSEVGFSRLLRGRVEEIALDERAARPLVYYRGDYQSVGPRRD